ncbi:GNAT family N-acetyltransferase [Xanthocytophaga agilis]|uniref:GNAT family N-acetyltransferase n=1 Tax=Xanthocytophaga agilis TaxID=3048010 RepID=A0AAE3R6X8_9BACT|nr:GNAT family N-acetyltransferase [Xanthocytophaga agilis]MDJ1502555.1 GNAT family N-acetyltransferase [Xanthocytophaga agilis]
MEVQLAHTEKDFLKCWEVIHALRPHLTIEEYLALLTKMTQSGYSLIFIEDGDKAAAALGFRYMTMFYAGNIIYIDDLTTLPESRGKGYASTLLDYIIEKAKNEGLNGVHLDSGHQRFDAHRLYLNKGFRITCHHFQLDLSRR